jgi:hypothetical protein
MLNPLAGAERVEQEIGSGRDPLQLPPQPEAPGWLSLWASHARSGVTSGLVSLLNRPGYEPSSTFNPFQYIKENPELENDPLVRELVLRGQFDESRTRAQFYFDLETGKSLFADMENIGRASGLANFTVGFLQSTPTMVVPMAPALSAATSTGRLLATGAAVGAGTTLAQKLALNELSPATNEPGVADEVGAAAMGGLFGVGFAGAAKGLGLVGHLGSPQRLGWQRALSKAKMEDVQDLWMRNMMGERFGPGAVKANDPSTLPFAGEKIPAAMKAVAQDTVERIDELMAKDPIDHATVSAIRGPETEAKIAALEKKYKDAGATLHVLEHPQQWLYEFNELASKLFSSDGMNVEATPADFKYGLASQVYSKAQTGIARAISTVTPTGRLAARFHGEVVQTRLQDVLRLVSASEQTKTKGMVLDPLGFNSGVNAEQIRTNYQKRSSGATVAYERAFAEARRTDPMARQYTKSQYALEVETYRRLRDAKAKGFIADLPEVPAFIKRGADELKAYYNNMADDMEGTGMLAVGKRALAQAEERMALLESDYAKAQAAYKEAAVDAEGNARAASPEAAKAIQKARTELQIAKQEHATISKAVGEMADYNPQVWDRAAVRANQESIVRRLTQHFAKEDAQGLPMNDQPLNIRAISGMEDDLRALAATKKGSPLEDSELPTDYLKFGDLTDTLRDAYLAKLDAHYRSEAVSAVENIISDGNDHGVLDAMGGMNDALKRRVLRINQSEFAEFLVTDPVQKLLRYDYALSGQVAIRRALQLDPERWGNAKLSDGTPVTDVDTLKAYVGEALRANERIAARQDQANGTDAASPKSLTRQAESLSRLVEEKLMIPLDEIAGRRPLTTDNAVRWVDTVMATATPITAASKLGSAALASLTDLAPMAINAMAKPSLVGEFARVIRHVKDAGLSADLEALQLVTDHMARSHHLSDIDPLTTSLGTTRMERVQQGAVKVGDFVHRASGLEWLTNFQKRSAGLVVMNEVTQGASKMARYAQELASGTNEAAAMRKAGLDVRSLADLNQLGLNAAKAKHLLELLHQYGEVRQNGKYVPIRDLIDKDAYVNGGKLPKSAKSMIRPNFSKWDVDVTTTRGRSNKDLYDTLSATLTARVERQMVVTPGRFDRPIMSRAWWGKIFNQFQNFLFAFSNQRLRVMAQYPMSSHLGYVGVYLGLGAISKAIADHLSGRRTFDDTIKAWEEKPAAAIYEAWDRAGLASWLSRPLGIADALGIPYSPGNMTGANTATTTARHMTTGRAMGLISPVLADFWSALNVGADVAAGRADQRTAFNAWKLVPGQNLIWLRLLHNTTGAPVVPESIKPEPTR